MDAQKSILIVGTDLPESLADWFEVSGYTVRSVASAAEALEMARIGPSASLIVAWALPDENGVEEQCIRVKAEREQATLRHEINNALFAITGSAESALKRLHALAACQTPGAQEILPALERILKGAERIRQLLT